MSIQSSFADHATFLLLLIVSILFTFSVEQLVYGTNFTAIDAADEERQVKGMIRRMRMQVSIKSCPHLALVV